MYIVGFSLLRLLRSGRRYIAGLEDDKVWALLGMVDFNLPSDTIAAIRDLSRFPSKNGIPLDIDPTSDAGKSRWGARVAVAQYLLRGDQSLDVMDLVQGLEPTSPSWAPRWTDSDGKGVRHPVLGSRFDNGQPLCL
jgi:hypothetical protein